MSDVNDKEELIKESYVLEEKRRHNIVVGSMLNDLDEVVRALNEDPKCINTIDPETKMTALHWAGANGNYLIAELLFNHEDDLVDPFLKDSWGRIPIDLALGCGNQKVIDFFQQRMFADDFNHEHDVFEKNDGPDGLG